MALSASSAQSRNTSGTPTVLRATIGQAYVSIRQSIQAGELPGLPPPSSNVTLTINRTSAVATSRFQLGVTHTQYSLDATGDADSVGRALNLLKALPAPQNQHIMGWGAYNPEPAPGVYDWSSLDTRVGVIRASGGEPVLTLCCAPDWMKGGKAGTTDWSRLEAAPLPEHYGDFAALAQRVAMRYPDVHYYQVWNELKGFWRFGESRPDYEGYTDLYNAVYDALKAVNPAIQVGGPYVILDSNPDHSTGNESALAGAYGTIDQRSLDSITYWLAHKHGADFITLDVSTFDDATSDPFAALEKFSDVTAWVRQRTDLPLWWAEWYVTPWGSGDYSDDKQNAVMTSALVRMIKDGNSVALRWQPQGIIDLGNGDAESLWTDTRQPGGGQPFPFYFSARSIRENFGPNTLIYRTTASTNDVDAIASRTAVLLVNKTDKRQVVRISGGQTVVLAPYQVRLTSLSPQS